MCMATVLFKISIFGLLLLGWVFGKTPIPDRAIVFIGTLGRCFVASFAHRVVVVDNTMLPIRGGLRKLRLVAKNCEYKDLRMICRHKEPSLQWLELDLMHSFVPSEDLEALLLTPSWTLIPHLTLRLNAAKEVGKPSFVSWKNVRPKVWSNRCHSI